MRSKYDLICEVEKARYDHIEDIEKFNPYHDAKGRFSTADGAAMFTYAPGKSRAHDLAIQREKERHAAMIAAETKPRKGLSSGLGEEHARAIEKMVQENAPPEIKKMWEKYGDAIMVGDSDLKGRGAYQLGGRIHVNIQKDTNPGRTPDPQGRTPPDYESTMHESGHAIDWTIHHRTGVRSSGYNGGEFEASLKSEASAYIKEYQRTMSQNSGRKVPVTEARKQLGLQMFRDGFVTTGDVSDMLEGATNGNFSGSAGHGKSYWTGRKTYYGRTEGHSVATEAFAEMFSASITNPASLGKIKEVFPESYKVFLRMCEEA